MAKRNLIIQSISNNTIKKNFEKAVLVPNNESFWAGASKSWNPKILTESTFKKSVFNKTQIGDVIIFPKKNKVNYGGIITRKITDRQEIDQIGLTLPKPKPGQVAQPFDLAFAFEKIKIDIPDILDYIDYKNLPRQTVIVTKNQDKRFWEEFSKAIDNYGIDLIQLSVIKKEKPEKVYMFGNVKDQGEGPVKIGYSDNVESRMYHHDEVAEELELYFVMESPNGCGYDFEKRIHDKFIKERIIKKSWDKLKKRKTESFRVSAETAIAAAEEIATYMETLN